MMIRISLVVAIIAALAAGALNFVKVREKITTLVTQRDTERGQKENAQKDLAKTKKELDKSDKELKQTQQTLETAKTERDKAVADATVQAKRATDLSDKLTRMNQERDDARNEVAAFKATGRSPEQILTLDKEIKQTQEALEASIEEKKILDRKLRRTEIELAKYTEKDYHVPLPGNLKGTILVADPKWDFVVLNVGEDQGILPDGELLVNRNGRLVAKVRVSSVQKDRSIANVMPGWKLGEVMEGDLVIPAYPSS